MDIKERKLYHSTTGTKENKKSTSKGIGFYVFLFIVFIIAYSYFSFYYFT